MFNRRNGGNRRNEGNGRRVFPLQPIQDPVRLLRRINILATSVIDNRISPQQEQQQAQEILNEINALTEANLEIFRNNYHRYVGASTGTSLTEGSSNTTPIFIPDSNANIRLGRNTPVRFAQAITLAPQNQNIESTRNLTASTISSLGSSSISSLGSDSHLNPDIPFV